LVITASDLESIFHGVVKKILLLLRGQIRNISTNKADPAPPIILVGGFGSSEYLRRCIKQEFPDSQVVQPPEA
jgi:hypothetical protein